MPIGSRGKRFIDVTLALFGIVFLSPLFLFCCLLCLVSSPGPIIFGHHRIGYGGRVFKCFKFRTMVVDADARLRAYLATDPAANAEWLSSRKLRNDPRVTTIGAVLRRSSLDELPQLFNILVGDMSVVGPRPITEDELSNYSSRAKDYFACRPGITGLWQVSGRSSTTYRRRVACDTYYARNWSSFLDLKIMIATVPALFRTDGAY